MCVCVCVVRQHLDSKSIAFHLKNYSIPKSMSRKILVENTTIIAHEIDKLRPHILEALDMKKKNPKNINQ